MVLIESEHKNEKDAVACFIQFLSNFEEVENNADTDSSGA